MKRIICALAGLVSLAGCNTQTSPATTPAQATRPQQAGPPANSPGTDYQVYRTQLPGQADSVTLHLVTAPRGFDATGTAGRFGSYYGPAGRPYTLQGQPSAAPDSVVLFETSPEKAIDPNGSTLYWRLRRQPGGDLAGAVGQQPVRLRLVRPAAGALTFVVHYFADSVAAFPREARSPKAHLSVQALVPVGQPQTLATSILSGLRGDTIDGIPSTSLAALYKQQRQNYFKNYHEDAADSRPTPADTAGIGAYAPGLTYENQTAAYVLYQQGNLLSLGFFRYDYSGGAHGNYGTTAASYDLRTGRRLRYADIFQPAAARQLPALLARAVRPLVGLQANEPLDKQLMVNTIPVTHNVFLTEGGAVFIYQPYEIASYAQGEIRVFLPLSELRPLLREGLPLPASGVATR
ncbi:DUF3298 domain-containing protein [Hymenobacter sp. UV11]|uniref:DUF3298 and DUF4163 domain-containing protein n=1 Tax=Hymenobacter sp. UV11 TaxID=1849735 RepID=UPI001061E3F7|nr:DUF3298 and DUF4163 domain-containing protein [Hymenobacter sp. UV11]TDN38450.1 hypothetical protein A8B98_24160 [Hymenobacter sp. UV11]TFZ67947.1 DUF3298 domain-containing protein [Hymenobacter sp. UV11]